VFDALQRFDDKFSRKIKFKDMRIVVSVGDELVEKFASKIKSGHLKIPDNVFLFSKVPQIEILKRASLFITHTGMNSASETIKYGIPIIALPIAVDQPMVAQTLCDDLKLGICFDYKNLNKEKLNDAIEEILTNQSYMENVLELSNVAQKYDGVEQASRLVLDYLNDNLVEKKTN
jgi:MGT family glycosyltransferase